MTSFKSAGKGRREQNSEFNSTGEAGDNDWEVLRIWWGNHRPLDRRLNSQPESAFPYLPDGREYYKMDQGTCPN